MNSAWVKNIQIKKEPLKAKKHAVKPWQNMYKGIRTKKIKNKIKRLRDVFALRYTYISAGIIVIFLL